jgi:hypothetical protein
MPRLYAMSLLGLLVVGVLLSAQDEVPAPSGLKEGAFLPKPFGCYNINGDHKGTFHCLVCDYALLPSVLVFARETEEGKDAALAALLKRLEDATVEFKNQQLRAAVVFLSADAQSSATNATEADPAKLVEEAKKREALYARLSERSVGFKGVDLAVFPAEGPKGYAINPKAEVSVVFYYKLRVVMSRAYEPGKFADDDVEKFLAKVKDTLEPPKKKK